jgi:hypothetical protein
VRPVRTYVKGGEYFRNNQKYAGYGPAAGNWERDAGRLWEMSVKDVEEAMGVGAVPHAHAAHAAHAKAGAGAGGTVAPEAMHMARQ